MKMLRALSPAKRGIYAVIVAAIACGISAVPLASAADNGYSTLVHDQLTMTDADGGDGDNVAEPGETVNLSERIRNIGDSSVNTLSGYLYSGNALLSVGAGFSAYPDLIPGATGTNASPFRATLSPQAVCGTSFQLELSINSAQGWFSVPVRTKVGATGTPIARNSTNVPIQIPSLATVESTMNVTDPGLIGHISVRIGELRHTWDEDLRISLIAPDQTKVILAQYVGGSGDDFINTVFDDDAQTSIYDASAPFTGTFRPAEPLALLGGRQQAGVWKLQIEDVYSEDDGTLYSWGDDAGLALCNRAPEASMLYDDLRAKETVTFESTSSDPDGSIVSQAWDLDNDGEFDDGTDSTATWRYPQAGDYVARLRVVDNGGESAIAVEELVVEKAQITCVVPRLRGKKLASARRAIRRGHCKVGRVRYAPSSRPRGRVLSQSPRAGAKKPVGTKVRLVVSRGR